MNYTLSFDPPNVRDQNGPDFPKPVKILLDNKEVGHFLFSQENIFQIFLYVDYESKPGWREVLLDQTFSHEASCREWIISIMPTAVLGYKLHFLS